MTSIKVILDVDTGTDDAMAIMMSLSRASVELLSITCVHGNVDVRQVCRNTLKVLQVCGQTQVPVYQGCDRPLVSDRLAAPSYHGHDGLGDFDCGFDPDLSVLQPEHAAHGLMTQVNKYPGEVTLVALGPLTNVAVALQLDPDLGQKLRHCVVMGGNINARGRVSLCAEHNFFVDPEAAYIVLDRLQCPITLLPYEVARASGQPLKVYDKITSRETARSHFLEQMTRNMVEKLRDKQLTFTACDPVAMAIAIEHSIIEETEDRFCTVELSGKFTRGQMIVDWLNQTGKRQNARIVKKVHIDKITKLLLEMVV